VTISVAEQSTAPVSLGDPRSGASAVADSNTPMVELLDRAVALEASDVHLSPGCPPAFRRNGLLRSEGSEPLGAEQVRRLIQSVCPEVVWSRLCKDRDVDFAVAREVGGVCYRFRVNAHFAQEAMGCSVRVIRGVVPTLEWTGFPQEVARRIVDLRNGLVLFTGVTGSGKSTSMGR